MMESANTTELTSSLNDYDAMEKLPGYIMYAIEVLRIVIKNHYCIFHTVLYLSSALSFC